MILPHAQQSLVELQERNFFGVWKEATNREKEMACEEIEPLDVVVVQADDGTQLYATSNRRLAVYLAFQLTRRHEAVWVWCVIRPRDDKLRERNCFGVWKEATKKEKENGHCKQ